MSCAVRLAMSIYEERRDRFVDQDALKELDVLSERAHSFLSSLSFPRLATGPRETHWLTGFPGSARQGNKASRRHQPDPQLLHRCREGSGER